jgi:hypothetical protein
LGVGNQADQIDEIDQIKEAKMAKSEKRLIGLVFLVLIFCFLFSWPCWADLSFRVMMKMGPVSMTSSHYLKGDKMVINRENGLSGIYLLDEGRIILMDRGRKVYSEFTIDSGEGEKLRNLLREDSLTIGKHAAIESLGKKGKIHGLDCEYKRMKLDYGGITFDYTACVSKDPPPEIKRFSQLVNSPEESEWVIKAEGEINGVRVSYEIFDVSFDPIDDSVFSVPAGYRKFR